MKGINLLLIILMLTSSCSNLPKLDPGKPSIISDIHKRCSAPFINGKWQLIHSIEATMPDGKKGFVVGITVISPQTGTIHCVVMTIEGLVVFDAQYRQKVIINRGIPPFDSTNFARDLINNIKLVFFKPDGQLIEFGRQNNGSYVCRYRNNNGTIVDVITNKDNTWIIRQYNNKFCLTHTVRACLPKKLSVSQKMFPGRLELISHGTVGYSLVLELINAELL
jgi:hypothetical protein